MRRAVLVVCVFLAGCVERVERIQVRDDGAVTMRLRFEADQAGELEPGRVPTRDMGWTIRRTTKRDEDGEVTKHVLEAERPFEAGDDLPATYASDTDPHAERHLQFPTTVTIEPRIDGLYFHFRRVYAARPHAVIDGIRNELLARHDLETTDDIDVDEMSDAQLVAIIRTLTRFEAEKCLVFARGAYLDLTPFRGQDGWLALRTDVLQVYEQIGDEHYRDFVRKLRRANAGEDVTFDDDADAFRARMFEAIQDALRDACNYDRPLIDAFADRFRIQEESFKTTERLQAETLTIEVEMPGEIVGANTDDVRGATAVWTFNGRVLWDRDRELMVTSRVAR